MFPKAFIQEQIRLHLVRSAICAACFAAGWVARPLAPPPLAYASSSEASPTPFVPKSQSEGVRESLRWSTIESDTYDAFLRNLRGIGCPEDVVRDLVVAELYCDERGLTTEGAGPWNELLTSLPDKARAEAIATEANRIFGRPLLAVGGAGTVDASPPQTIAAAEPASPVESIEAAFAAGLDRLWTSIGMRNPTDAERNSLLDLESKRQVELEKIYDPEQLERYEMDRTGRLNEMQKRFSALNLNDDEAVALIRLHDYEADDAALGSAPAPIETMRHQRADAYRKLLGDERYELYRRLNDPTYSMLDSVAQRHGVSAEATVKAYAMISTGEVVSGATGSFEAELKRALGEAAFQDWVQIGEAIQATLARALGPGSGSKLDYPDVHQ